MVKQNEKPGRSRVIIGTPLYRHANRFALGIAGALIAFNVGLGIYTHGSDFPERQPEYFSQHQELETRILRAGSYLRGATEQTLRGELVYLRENNPVVNTLIPIFQGLFGRGTSEHNSDSDTEQPEVAKQNSDSDTEKLPEVANTISTKSQSGSASEEASK